MKFNMMKLIRKSLLVSVMLGSSAFVFNNIYAENTFTSSLVQPTTEQAVVIEKMRSSMADKYESWLKSNENASETEKTNKQAELANEAYNDLSDSDKKIMDSYVKSATGSVSSTSGSSSNKKTTNTSSKKSTTSTNTATKKASSSAKTKTGDPCSLSLLGMSLLGSLSTCVILRKKY